ncbi:DNA (cytosine-5-)-methyltransferase [Enterococcus avium]|uniref:DNA cytosine methyltransferase n=1 Tax=Enterococcus avium TaxID=33945 RepID=UPI001D08FD38|nr:DNA (cytosine-5-)-methyltransferase [Enterococcus avium]MCB6915550.1 DNA (cytosine-5-)-methyltransferase [Enterococcus avium]MCQ4959584.1 DNA (cytosine-5-)-methyltransferase [Enterococcus avium]
MKFLDLFAGIGGFRLGMEQAGHECVGFCEIDKFARKSYKAIHNTEGEVKMHDITTVSDEFIRGIGSVDIICGGFPCQAFSVAGKRKGFEDTRGTLFFEIARFASVLRPKFLFLENVKGLLNHEGGATFEVILRTLDELGYDVEWQVLNSKDYVPQNRERVFIIGHLRGASTRKVFPFARNDSETNRQYRIKKIGNIRKKGLSQSGDVVSVDILVAGNLPGNHDQNSRVYDPSGLSPTLSTMQGGGQEPKILQKPRGFNDGGAHKIAPTLSSNSWHENNLLEIGGVYTNDSADFNRGALSGLSRSIKAQNHDAGVFDGMRIRKLTPRECWRLQAFPDWAFDRAAAVNSDSQLYKQAGNSVTVAVIFDIARRLKLR